MSLALCLVLVAPAMPMDFPHAARPSGPALTGASTPSNAPVVTYPSLPRASYFIENRGQVADPSVLFVASGGGLSYSFGTTFILARPPRAGGAPEPSRTVLIDFEGSNPSRPTGGDPASTSYNYLRGSDGARWVTGAAPFGELTYAGLYPGTDLVLQIGPAGLKYEFQLAAGTHPSGIAVRVSHADGLSLDSEGRLLVRAGTLTLVDAAPSAFQGSLPVDCTFVLRATDTYGFDCAGFDPRLPLTIDPLVFATYLGGGGQESIEEVSFGPAGRIYVAGHSNSADFPTTAGTLNGNNSGGYDVFVARLSPDGTSLEYATYIGGSSFEFPVSLHVDLTGAAYVVGLTSSADFPTTGGAWRTSLAPNGTGDSFAVKLSPDGSTLVYGTLLGGTNNHARGAALAPDGTVLVAGEAYVRDLPPPTSGAWTDLNPNATTGQDGFVAWLSPAGDSLEHGAYLGGGLRDGAWGTDFDAAGNAWVVGTTSSPDLPTTTNAFQPNISNNSDAFLVELNATGEAILYSSFLGAEGPEIAYSVSLGPDGDPVVFGHTYSQLLPTTPGVFQPYPGKNGTRGTSDCFLAKFGASDGAPQFISYLGGALDESCFGDVVVAPDLTIYATSYTEGFDFPTTPNAHKASNYSVSNDGFLVKVNAAGSGIDYSTLVGGSGNDFSLGLALGGNGKAALAMYTIDSDLYTSPGALDDVRGGPTEGYVVLLAVPEPTLFLYTPVDGSNVTVPSVRVTGLTDPGVNLSVNGIRANVPGNGSFSLVVSLLPGDNTITAVAAAPDGTSATATTTVRFTDPLPALLAQIQALQLQLNATDAALVATEAALNARSADLNATRQDLNQSRRDLNATQAQLVATQDQMVSLQSDIASLGTQLSAARLDLDGERQRGNATAADLEAASANLSAAVARLDDLQSLLDATRATANGTGLAYQQLLGRLAAQEAALNATTAGLGQANDDLAATREDLNRTRNELADTRALATAAILGVVALGAAVVLLVWVQRRRRN